MKGAGFSPYIKPALKSGALDGMRRQMNPKDNNNSNNKNANEGKNKNTLTQSAVS